MSIPATVYVAIGAAAAALIAGWTSATNIIIAKDQKISEFRQKWIDELREATSELSCNFSMLSSTIHFHNIVKAKQSEATKEKNGFDAFFKFGQPIAHQCTKIRLLLNTKDDTIAISSLEKLENTLDDVSENLANPENIEALLLTFETDIKTILSTEWAIVKSGEPDYQNYKKASELYPIALFVLILVAVIIAQAVHT